MYTILMVFGIEDLIPIEDLFKVNVSIYQLNEESARLVYRSRGLYQETMALNKYQNHLSLVTDFEKYCALYRCMSLISCIMGELISYAIVKHVKSSPGKLSQGYI